MIIDIHTHTFPQGIAKSALQSMQQNCHTALFSDGTESELLLTEQLAHVDLAVVQPVATNPNKVSHLNDYIIEKNKIQGRNIISFGAMHPACPYWEQELERLKFYDFRGIKLHPPYERIDIDDPRTISILRKCKELGLIVLIHGGRDVGLPGSEAALPKKIRHALDAVGPLKMIVAHMGGWGCWNEVVPLLSDTGIYLDTAFSLGMMTPANDGYNWADEELQLLSENEFCNIVHSFGADRILFGTDSPWANPKEEVNKIKQLQLEQAEVELILGTNAERLLSLNPGK